MIDLDVAVRIAERLVEAAAAEIRPCFRGRFASERKADVSPVTDVDRAAERAMREILARERPHDRIYGEEFGESGAESPLTWVLDPIDGTKAFMTGRPTFVTLVALLDEGRPVLGVIDQPILGDRWIGAAGRPTTFNGEVARTRICDNLSDAAFSTTDPGLFPGGDAQVYERVSSAAGMRTYGGDGYAYGLLAAGWIDIVLESGLKLYDFAALVPVIEGAGGVITSWEGQTLGPGSDGRVAAAGCAGLHARLLERIKLA